MTKVLIADDEPLVRIGVKSSIDWEKLGLVLVGEAENGKETLELIERYSPDIILLDIGMPVMSGIQVLQAMKAKGIRAQTLVLSCHNEIDYVKQAIKLGAFDYVLKLSLKSEDLEQHILEMKEQIKKDQSLSFQDFRESAASYLFKIFNYLSVRPEEKDQEPIAELQAVLAAQDFHLILADIDRMDSGKFNTCKNILCEISQTTLKSTIRWYYGSPCYHQIVILCFDISPQLLQTLVTRLSAALTSYTNLPFAIGVSTAFHGEEKLTEALRQADSALSQQFYCDKSTFWASEAFPYQDAPLIRMETETAIYHSIEMGDMESARLLIHQILEEAEKYHRLHPSVLKSNMIEITNLFVKHLKIHGMALGDISDDYSCLFQRILQCKQISQLRLLYDRFIDDYGEKISEIKKSRNREEIQKAWKFIAEHYKEPITLSDIAGYVNMSKNYFSYLFKKETGESYIHSLNRIRIEEAKQLFQTGNYKVYEVAEMVGYNNTNYFNEIFKRLTGQNPNSFKK